MKSHDKNSITIDTIDETLSNSAYVKDMLRYFDEGYDARGIDDKKNRINRIKANIYNSVIYTSEVIKLVTSSGFTPKSVYAKMDTPANSIIMIGVELEDYLNDNFRAIYDYVTELERTSRSENFSIHFSLTYDDGEFNEECIKADGYANISDLINE